MIESDAFRDAEVFFHQKIPLTRAMRVRVVSHGASGFAIEAPVALNHNHLRTAFGGSINSIATLAAYAFVWFELREQHAEVVVAESSIRFLAPIRQTICGICTPPDPELLAAFRADFARHGKARISLRVVVEENAVTAADFRGTFVVVRARARID